MHCSIVIANLEVWGEVSQDNCTLFELKLRGVISVYILYVQFKRHLRNVLHRS